MKARPTATGGEPSSPARVAFGSVSGFIALGFGSGLAPVAPGTFGTLAALPLALALLALPETLFWPLLAGLFAVGVGVCAAASRELGRADPGSIVWDEMVAMWLVLACVPPSWPWWLAAFALFRIFDIAKPWPIRALERRVGGGLGIMLDDLVAAVFALATLWLARAVLPV